MDEKQVKSKVCGINIDKEIEEETVILLYKTFGIGAVQELDRKRINKIKVYSKVSYRKNIKIQKQKTSDTKSFNQNF
mgnify:CR=1 FL=1